MPEPYQYGVRILPMGRVDRYHDKASAASFARDFAISPLRTGPRHAELVRRRGWDGEWETLASWRSPEAER